MAPTAADTKAKQAATLAATPLASVAAEAKHFWLVDLHCPPGASEGLRAFISLADTAIQTAVDLLGRGMSMPPPKVDDLLEPAFYESLGKGKADEAYRKTIDKVEARQLQLLQMDNKVIKTSVTVAAEQVQALKSIKNIVADLNTKLKSAGTAKLKPAQELPLLKAVAAAVDAVYDKVTAIADLNEEAANGGNGQNGGGQNGGGQSGGGQAPGGGGGGDGGLSSLLPMLMMPLMAAAPLVAQIPEMLQKAEEDRAEKAEKAEQNQKAGAPAQPGNQNAPAPVPGDPNAAVPAGDPNAAPAANASGDPNVVPAAATMPPGQVQARRARNVPPTGQPGQEQPTPEDEADPEQGTVIEA
ncbi:hypothetical protein OHA40_08470 [Nocardia sp. NBC_00508]|uniref:hypothetical protein n=1 Tax=Nocardia sp. NBC_00508 TaxID=2975992 RepID=UPI002E7FC061|nr:hypothetical protein [Nocardia sp. NBC_00508]WUD68137.1 hypothetical protein OHA40_08470 [Nocardia sp. NBC_00508]